MQIKFLQYVFYALMCLPILALGVYFFIHLVKDISEISQAEKREKQEKIKQNILEISGKILPLRRRM